jgi:hypothetical protein
MGQTSNIWKLKFQPYQRIITSLEANDQAWKNKKLKKKNPLPNNSWKFIKKRLMHVTINSLEGKYNTITHMLEVIHGTITITHIICYLHQDPPLNWLIHLNWTRIGACKTYHETKENQLSHLTFTINLLLHIWHNPIAYFIFLN